MPLNALNSTNSTMNTAVNPVKPVRPFDFLKAGSKPVNKVQPPPLTAASGKSMSDKPKKMMLDEDMENFKNAIRGSNLTKVGIIEVLKKQFPQSTAAQVKDTLGVVASRVGKSEKEKVWVLNEEQESGVAAAS
jgi:chromatin assembly factor 1 subunit A